MNFPSLDYFALKKLDCQNSQKDQVCPCSNRWMYLNLKFQRLRLNCGFGYYVYSSKPKFRPKSIENWSFSPSSSVFLPLPPFPPISSHWWEFFFLPMRNIFSYQWDKLFVPLVGICCFFPTGGKKIFPTHENSLFSGSKALFKR